DEGGDVAPQGGDLPHQGRGYIGKLLGGGEEDRFRLVGEGPVHVGQLEFVFEVRYRPQAPEDGCGLPIAGEIHQQVVKTHHFHVVEVSKGGGRQLDAFVEVEQRLLLLALGNGDDHLIEQLAGALHQI